MSISQDSSATYVYKEVFDETSNPSKEEVLEFARRLGIDPDEEPHLLDLAREGLMAALPPGWSPCYHEATGSWYYYEETTGITSWEHPLDAVYKELVEKARAEHNRQMSVEEDPKTAAKDPEPQEEATLPDEATSSKEAEKSAGTKTTAPPTRIPTKLTPLKKLERSEGSRKKRAGSSIERLHSRRHSDSKADNLTSLSVGRAARDYTNLKFQDPKFYECPRLLETVEATTSASTTSTGTMTAARPSTASKPSKKELDLKEVLKRSESLSPRHEKDWEQLSSKFSSEENIIDIDKLSVTSLARAEKPEKFDKEKHPSQFGQQKELTLSGGGSMFLKSNRSRDTTPSQDGGKLDDFRALAIADEASKVAGDRLKSILREKQSEDDGRPLDEERKSVRFDLAKEVDVKFTYSGSEGEWDSDPEEQSVRISATVRNKTTGSILSSQKSISQSFDDENKGEEEEDEVEENVEEEVDDEEEDEKSNDREAPKSSPPPEKTEPLKKNSKIVGKRFVVQNVSENEHFSQVASSQMSRESVSRESSIDYTPSNEFENAKNVNAPSKSETDTSAQKSSDSDEQRRGASSTTKPRKSFARLSKDGQTEDDESSDMSRINDEAGPAQEERFSRSKLQHSMSFDETKAQLSAQHETEVESLKKKFEVKLEQTKKKLEANFVEQKIQLQQNLNERLEELKREMAEKEEQEIQKLIAEMDEARLENLKKVKAELEICYEKERQEILANLKTELDKRKRELLELRNQEMAKLENEYERDLNEEKLAKLNEFELTKQHTERIEAMKKELEKEFVEIRNKLRMQQREKVTKFTEEHEKCLADILRDFKMDENVARKVYKKRLEEIRADFSRDAEKEAKKQTERALQQESIDFEKMRCEKRLLQDKYMALKEKYMKLKNDVRLSVERRNKRKEVHAAASETERSASTRTRTELSNQNIPLRNTRSGTKTSNSKAQEGQLGTNEQAQEESTQDDSKSKKTGSEFQKNGAAAGSKAAVKDESTDTISSSETNANTMKRRKSLGKTASTATRAASSGVNNNNNNLENPVENIRKQLEKIEDLGDQLPSTETAYTLRYPFQDKGLYTLYFG